MVTERYPADTTVDKSDFDKGDCQRILDGSSGDGYASKYVALSNAASESLGNGNPKRAKIYWLLADACSMMLSPESHNEPFQPFAVIGGRRSAIPGDFTAEDLELFSEILPEIADFRLKARLADLLWTTASKRIVNHALAAIDAYLEMPLNEEVWWSGDGKACWHRAISLTLKLRDGAGDRIQRVRDGIRGAFDVATLSDGHFALSLSSLMLEFGLCRDSPEQIAEKLESLARQMKAKGDFLDSADHFKASSEWYKSAENDEKSIEMTACQADCYVSEASARQSADRPSNLVAVSYYENAIQILRTIPKVKRPIHNVDERIREIHKEMNEAGQLAIEEMCSITTEPLDITQIVKSSQADVSGKNLVEAFQCFVSICRRMQAAPMVEQAIQQVKVHSFHSSFSGTCFSRDGRVVAKTDGINSDSDLDGDNPKVHEVVMRNHQISVGLVVQGCILPALEILRIEHRVVERDFLTITARSPIIPLGREVLFAKGLFAGYDGDYVTALHLLVPQVENMVRHHLKQAGAVTSRVCDDGTEKENGLSTLIELPEMVQVFGEDLTFEIRALFCDQMGANLRNEIAHGLVDHNACNSIYGVYAWWLVFNLIFIAFWKTCSQSVASTPEAQ